MAMAVMWLNMIYVFIYDYKWLSDMLINFHPDHFSHVSIHRRFSWSKMVEQDPKWLGKIQPWLGDRGSSQTSWSHYERGRAIFTSLKFGDSLWHWACLRPPCGQFCDATLPGWAYGIGFSVLHFCLFRTNAFRLTYQTISFKHVLVHWSLFRLKWILSDMPWSSKVPNGKHLLSIMTQKAMVQQKSYILVN